MNPPRAHPSEWQPHPGPDPIERVTEPAPAVRKPPTWFNVAYVSLAVFAGPALLALVVGLVAVLAATAAGVLEIVKKGAGL